MFGSGYGYRGFGGFGGYGGYGGCGGFGGYNPRGYLAAGIGYPYQGGLAYAGLGYGYPYGGFGYPGVPLIY